MTSKYSFRFSSIIFWILSIIILILWMLYMAEQSKYENEKEKLDMATMYLYDLEIESTLNVILISLGLRPVEAVNWEEQEFRERLISHFEKLEEGISNINSSGLEGIPEKIHTELHNFQGKISYLLKSIQEKKLLEDKTKNEIMNLSNAIYTCKVDEYNRSWEQITSEVDCLNNKIFTDDKK